jgi:hypothetical protein
LGALRTKAVRFLISGLLLAIVFAIVIFGTKSTFFGDTSIYVGEIASVLEGHSPKTSLLDFGHLVWRPLGLALTTVPADLDPPMVRHRVSATLVGLNILISFICAITICALMRGVSGITTPAALLMAATFLSTNAALQLSRSGTSWLSGLACLLVASCLALYASRKDSLRLALCAAVLTAAAALLWVPYVLAAPVVACSPLLDFGEPRARERLYASCLRILPVAALIVLAAYAFAIFLRHITTASEFLAWMKAATHGESRDRQVLRMFFGLPRSFLVAGDDGVLFKQYLFRDPYAGVGLWDILKASAWKIALFYAFGAAILFELLRNRRATGLLLWAMAGVLPTIGLAVLFEAGSIERYLALYPAIFLAAAWVLSERRTAALSRIAVAAFCAALIGNNLYANWRSRVDSQRAYNALRLAPVLSQSKAAKPVLYVLNIRDGLMGLYDPIDPASDDLPRITPLVPSSGDQIGDWTELFGRDSLRTWDQGEALWVTKRVRAARPQRDWLWAEGDDRRIRWNNIRDTLAAFETDCIGGDSDGFCRIPDTASNRDAAMRLAAGQYRADFRSRMGRFEPPARAPVRSQQQ